MLLAYSSAHFTALVPMEMEEEDCMVVPLAQANGQYLPIQFIDQREFPPGVLFLVLNSQVSPQKISTLPM